VHAASFLLSGTLLVACASTPPTTTAAQGQPAVDAVRRFCDVDRLAGLSPDEGPLELGRKRTEWLQTHVDSPDGIELRTLLSVKTPAEQAALLRERAATAGLGRCVLADSLDQSGIGAISP
jgi:hypothetical protein